ncbi:MAG: SH3 domain-containing protein [Eubacteriales bacterium]
MRNKTWIRLLAGLFCVALLIGLMPMQSAHAESAIASGFVNTTKLNLRKGAGTGNSIVDTLAANTAVNIYEVVGTWLRIDVPSTGKSGYVSGKYITVNSASLSAYALGSTSGRVNLRKEATSKSDSLAYRRRQSGTDRLFRGRQDRLV